MSLSERYTVTLQYSIPSKHDQPLLEKTELFVEKCLLDEQPSQALIQEAHTQGYRVSASLTDKGIVEWRFSGIHHDTSGLFIPLLLNYAQLVSLKRDLGLPDTDPDPDPDSDTGTDIGIGTP